MSTFKVELPSELPIWAHSDVIVVGGGPGGIGAAVATARGGASVTLVEHYGFLGGMATAGEVNPFMPNHLDGKSLDLGIFSEWLDRIVRYGGARPGSRVFDPNVARLAAEDLCIESGVQLLYHHRAVHAAVKGRTIQALALHSKSGLGVVTADTFIDSTGDGDVAALAGCGFHFGSETTGHAQPMTLCFKLKLAREDVPDAIDDEHLYRIAGSYFEEIQAVYLKAQKDGRITCPRENVLIFPSMERDVVHFNTTRIIQKSAINGSELSEAEIEGRAQLRQIWQVLKQDVPIFRHSTLHSIAPQVGVRESRRIVGRYYLTVDDYTQGRRFSDAVARVTYPIDIHNPGGRGTVMKHLPKGKWYEVPWRCLLPQSIDNLGIGSRCISADHATHSSLRVMPPVCSIGQAVGTAAAMAKRQGIAISQVDGEELNHTLMRLGRNLVTCEDGSEAVASATGSDASQEKRDRLAAERYSA